MIDLSVNEARALLTKAGKGAGLSWGEAQDFAAAVLSQPTLAESYLKLLNEPGLSSLRVILIAADYSEDLDDPLFTALVSGAKPSIRVSVRQEVLDGFTKLAAKTYVPATEESRLAGAGAGTNDND